MDRARLFQLRDEITSRAFGCWWCHELAGISAVVPHLGGALSALGRVNGEVCLEGLPRQQGPMATSRLGWNNVAGQTTVVAPATRLLQGIAGLLQNQDGRVRYVAAGTVGVLGNASATPEILTSLAQLLQDQDGSVRYVAAGAVRALGSTAATPEFLARLAQLLQDKEEVVRYTAVGVVRALGSSADTPEILAGLHQLCQDQDSNVWCDASEALASLRPREFAFLAVIGRQSYTIELDWWRERDAEACGSFAARQKQKSRASQIHFCLDVDADVRREAAQALGSGEASPEFLARLAELLQHGSSQVRSLAAEAVEALGSVEPTSEILPRLTPLLQDQDSHLKLGAEALGSVAATPAFLALLAQLLEHRNSHVRSSAARAVVALGSSAATLEIFARMVELLQDQDREVQLAAADAVGSLGSATTTSEILVRLNQFLQDQGEHVRWAAAEGLRNVMKAGVRLFSGRPGQPVWVRSLAQVH